MGSGRQLKSFCVMLGIDVYFCKLICTIILVALNFPFPKIIQHNYLFSTKNILVQHICAFVEVASGTLAALLVLPPTGTIGLLVCSPKALSDWYTLLHNPQPDYQDTLHCTQEAVYPL